MEHPHWTPKQLKALQADLESASPRAILQWSYETFGDDVVMATGFGTSGIVLTHILSELRPGSDVFYLDTDLLFPETYALRDQLASQLDIHFVRVHGGLSVADQDAEHGPALWERNANQCCFLRKVLPLRSFLQGREAWITGIRRDQARTRARASVVDWDPANQLIKINPLAYWTSEDVWSYIRLNELPYNTLHDRGYPSIGCMPCTRAVGAGEHERSGRWAGLDKVECGIHLNTQAA
ncbi:MAG: phosphoadenylyl-sulfate reductase [Rhodothermales bacterium]